MRALRRDIRLLKIYAGGSTLALVFLAGAAFRQAQAPRQKFGEIDAERINIVENDGRVRLVLANSARQAVTVIDGKQILPGRARDAGLIFFNDEGDEDGGMTWSGRTTDGAARASAGLSFDQYKQDETVTLRYSQSGKDRSAGLTIADRPEASLGVAVKLNDATSDDARAKVREELVRSGVLGSRPRAFIGKDPAGTSRVALSDGNGKPRLVLTVDKAGAAKIEFLNDDGKVARTIQPD
jgi:hypothetical protein